ncbi:MAG TPA: DUF3068 domain-containing protein [Micromonosporaceae bacterium]
MRRIIGLLLIAVGAFALALGLLMPLYAYPNLARLERGGAVIQTIAEGSGMTVFDPKSVTDPQLPVERQNVDVVANRTIKGLTSAPEAKPRGNVAVWEVGLVIMDQTNPNPQEPISVVEDKICIDRRTSAAVHPCSSEYVKDNGRSPEHRVYTGRHEGQIYKFPFGTERKNYRYFDTIVREAPVARYVKDEKLGGLTVYRFEQVIPRKQIEEREVPGRLLGLPEQDVVVAGRYYENRRTMWVEPETGVIVKGTEEVQQTLEDPASGASLTLIAGTLEINKATFDANTKRAKDGIGKLRMLRVTAPWVLGIGGGVLIVVGLLVAFIGRRRSEPLFRED